MRLAKIQPLEWFESNPDIFTDYTGDFWPDAEAFKKWDDTKTGNFKKWVDRDDPGCVVDLEYDYTEIDVEWAVEYYLTKEEQPEYYL
jgi:hypothetical protein